MNLDDVEKNMAAPDADAPGHWPTSLEIACAARSDMCVLLTGLPEAAQDVAYRIHTISGWRHGEFLIVDCLQNESLVERLFGSPVADDAGPQAGGLPGLRLVQAGSVLLQEVGRLSPRLQEQLADYLAASRLESPFGRSRWRLLASTSEPLVDRVNTGSFSDRLYYRLNTIHLTIPRPDEPIPRDSVM